MLLTQFDLSVSLSIYIHTTRGKQNTSYDENIFLIVLSNRIKAVLKKTSYFLEFKKKTPQKSDFKVSLQNVKNVEHCGSTVPKIKDNLLIQSPRMNLHSETKIPVSVF